MKLVKYSIELFIIALHCNSCKEWMVSNISIINILLFQWFMMLIIIRGINTIIKMTNI